MGSILLRLANLGRHVERSTNVGRGEIVRLEDLGQTEVAQLDTVVVSEKDCGLLVQSSDNRRTRY
jgi:hypothetical protein